jgi:hypothetical protein
MGRWGECTGVIDGMEVGCERSSRSLLKRGGRSVNRLRWMSDERFGGGRGRGVTWCDRSTPASFELTFARCFEVVLPVMRLWGRGVTIDRVFSCGYTA